MGELRDEMEALVAEASALLDDLVRRGVRVEPVVQAPSPAEEEARRAEEAAREEAKRAAAAWSKLADRARSQARPHYAGDGTGAEGLRTIREDLGDCTRCRLCEGRQHIVYGVGDPDADLMVIGEGPGRREDQRGEPFVGPAGQMLDRMLENVLGLPRDKVYIANVVKCRPPKNRDPRPDEVGACKPFLERQIAAVQPKLLMVVGRVSLENVLGVKGITRNRGRTLRYGETPAVPILHPAYLLRLQQKGDTEAKRHTFMDLKKIRAMYDELGGRRGS